LNWLTRSLKPHLGRQGSKLPAGKTSSDDEEFAMDEVAECAIDDFLREVSLPIAYYSEDRGLVESGVPEYLLVIDPIDGTRPSMVGLEGGGIESDTAPEAACGNRRWNEAAG
jgi:myo-inositol-1(or 4)-monophosphatase